jgi:hypothetical protein
MNNLFGAALDDQEDETLRLWYEEPVVYRDIPHPVRRSTAFALHSIEFQSWSRLRDISRLPRAAVAPGNRIMSAAEAQTFLAQREMPGIRNPGRDA